MAPVNPPRPTDVSRARIPLAGAGLVLAIVLAYWNSLRTPFLFDDLGAVVNNPTIRQLGLAAFNPPADGSTTTGRPVVNFSFALNYAMSHEQVWSYHALNVAIHCLAALALFGIVRRTLLRDACGNAPSTAGRELSAYGLAFFTALLWAVHPLQTESVVGIAQRTESLCGLFYLLTLYAFTRSCTPPPIGTRAFAWPWQGLSVAACLLGMATKEVMVTAPLLVLLYDRTFAAGSFSAAVRLRRGYYSALASTWLVLAVLVGRGEGARGASAGFGLGLSAWNYLLQQTEAICLYLKLSFWPHPLVLDYGTAVPHSLAEVAGPAIVVTALLAATLWALRRRPVTGFFGAAFFLILAPSSSVVPLATQTMAEHRMYLPLAAILCPVLAALYVRLRQFSHGVLALLALGFGGMTAARNRDYRDAVTMWTDNVTKYPGAARAHNNLALALQKSGRTAEADAQFARAVALDPAYVTAHYNFGVALLDQDRTAEAIVQLESAVALAPDHADAQVNLGNALVRARRSAEAIPHYLAALRLCPAADGYYNLGVAQLEENRPDDAATSFRAALQIDPTLAGAHYQLAQFADRSGAHADAEAEYRESLRYAPDHAAAHAKLGLLLARANRLPEAAEHLQAAVRLAPGDVDARANLGNVFLLQGQPRDAITCYEEVLRVRPNDSRTRENLQLARDALR